MCPRDLQAKKPLSAYVLGKFKQVVEVLVLAQWLAIDFDSECRFRDSIAEQGNGSRAVVLLRSPKKSLGGCRTVKPLRPLACLRVCRDQGVDQVCAM
jgi:hypothetical protein